MSTIRHLCEIAQQLPTSPSTSPVSVGGGCIHEAWNWGPYFIKINAVEAAPMFATEAESLKAIAASNSIRVPEFIAIGTTGDSSFLALERLDLFPSGNESLLGEQLAELHTHHAGQFGFAVDNYIGSTSQPNPWTEPWPDFFRDYRLGHLFTLLQRNGIRFSDSEALLDRIPDLLPRNPSPSLLHGDLWTGNKAFLKDGTPVIFDPACYHGHAACDLAMTRLFGGFSERFYDAYRSFSDMDDPSLHNLYNLYHVLNHALLFGGGYVTQAERAIHSILQT